MKQDLFEGFRDDLLEMGKAIVGTLKRELKKHSEEVQSALSLLAAEPKVVVDDGGKASEIGVGASNNDVDLHLLLDEQHRSTTEVLEELRNLRAMSSSTSLELRQEILSLKAEIEARELRTERGFAPMLEALDQQRAKTNSDFSVVLGELANLKMKADMDTMTRKEAADSVGIDVGELRRDVKEIAITVANSLKEIISYATTRREFDEINSNGETMNAIRTLQDDSDFLVSSLDDIRRKASNPAVMDSSTDLSVVLTEIRNAKEYNLDQVRVEFRTMDYRFPQIGEAIEKAKAEVLEEIRRVGAAPLSE